MIFCSHLANINNSLDLLNCIGSSCIIRLACSIYYLENPFSLYYIYIFKCNMFKWKPDTAPKEFEIWGWEYKKRQKGPLLIGKDEPSGAEEIGEGQVWAAARGCISADSLVLKEIEWVTGEAACTGRIQGGGGWDPHGQVHFDDPFSTEVSLQMVPNHPWGQAELVQGASPDLFESFFFCSGPRKSPSGIGRQEAASTLKKPKLLLPLAWRSGVKLVGTQ